MSDCVFRKGGPKKYYLTENFVANLHFTLPVPAPPGGITLHNSEGVPTNSMLSDGVITIIGNQLEIWTSYAWDGPSGPAIDTDNFMDGSLIHDALYDLMRQGLLSRKYRCKADKEMRIQCKKDGMSFVRRWYTWGAVRVGGYGASGGKLLG